MAQHDEHLHTERKYDHWMLLCGRKEGEQNAEPEAGSLSVSTLRSLLLPWTSCRVSGTKGEPLPVRLFLLLCSVVVRLPVVCVTPDGIHTHIQREGKRESRKKHLPARQTATDCLLITPSIVRVNKRKRRECAERPFDVKR